MATFRVEVKEVHIQGYIIETDNEDEAIRLILEGEGDLDEAHFEYSHTLDSSSWQVVEED